jgi:uncharacterized integral membrane protein
MNGRTAGGVAVAVLLVVWILLNRGSVDVSFLLWSAQIPLWLALSVAGILGATAGFLLGRRRYRGSRRRT